ncbi:hypothetical protein GF337_16935 [candidate division KSB1 bacterium]|nr:hypothetical protein [candidate division KSB1 bacterium]
MKPKLENIHKILIMQFKPYGDVLLTTSYLKALSERFPDAQIDFLVFESYHHILEKNPYIDNVIVLPKKKKLGYLTERIKLFYKINRRIYDLIIDQQNNTGSFEVLLFSGARYRLGWYNAKARMLYNIKARRGNTRYSASKKFDLLKPLGIEEQPYKLHYHIREESRQYIDDWLQQENLSGKPIICISPGSPVASKKWDLKNYARLADLILQNTDFPVVLLWGPREYQDVQTVAGNMQEQPVLAPPTDFNQAAAFLERCALLICNDGGLNHLSVATETPALAIFGRTTTKNWSPQGVFPGHYHIVNPDWKKDGDQTFGISPKDVFAKVRGILAELGVTSP